MSLVSGTVDKVIGDITGVTGLNILTAIINGERNPKKLAQLAHQRIKSSPEQIAKALTGNYREEMVFILNQELSLYQIYQQQILLIDEQIEQCLSKFESKTNEPLRQSKKNSNQKSKSAKFDLRSHLYRITGVDFTLIDGLNVLTVQKIARLFYTLWIKKESYVDQGAEYYEQQHRQRVIKNLKQRAKSLGLEVVEASSA